MSTNIIGTKNRRFYICSLSCDTIVYKVKLVILVVLTLSIIIIIIILLLLLLFIIIIKIFITKPQLKSYLQSTCCYKKSN